MSRPILAWAQMSEIEQPCSRFPTIHSFNRRWSRSTLPLSHPYQSKSVRHFLDRTVTRQYINIQHGLYESNGDDGFTTKVATTRKQILELLDVGFDYVMQKDGLAYFRKRK